MNRFIALLLIVLTIALTGCQEDQKTSKVWGNGDPPLEYQEMFGNSNTGRLDFVQSQEVEKLQRIIYGTTEKDDKGNIVRKQPGLIERIMALEDRQAVQDSIDQAIIKGVEGSINQEITDEHDCIIGQTLAAPYHRPHRPRGLDKDPE